MISRLFTYTLETPAIETLSLFDQWMILLNMLAGSPPRQVEPLPESTLVTKTRGEDPGIVTLEADFAIDTGDDGRDGFGTFDDLADIPIEIHGDDEDNILHGNAQDNWIYGYGGNDTIYGHSGHNNIDAGWGNDEVVGGSGVDAIDGGTGNDTLWGEDGDDAFRGGNGADQIHGGEGADVLFGDAGNDEMFGDAGDDWLADHSGDDTYSGGEGADTFVFSANGQLTFTPGGGQDLILDFELGVDKLIILRADPAFADLSFADYVDQHAFGQADPGVVIEWENGLIRLAGVSVADLNPWDIELW